MDKSPGQRNAPQLPVPQYKDPLDWPAWAWTENRLAVTQCPSLTGQQCHKEHQHPFSNQRP